MSTFVAVRFWKFAITSALIALSIGLVETNSSGATTLAFGVAQVFQETGAAVTTYQTPSNTCALLVDALGGAGGSGYNGPDSGSGYSDYGGSGGAGGSLSVVVPVSGTQTLSISVGQGGGNGTAGVAGNGGFGGGGAGGASSGSSAAAGGGGGESVVAILSGSTLAVAGGGGGGDDDWLVSYDEASGGPGGIGANTSGSAGANATGPYGGDYSPGQGGTLTGGGAGSVGVNGVNGSPGSANQGGAGASVSGFVGGGGAGGYFGGGGGGERSGGGGGSTYAITGWSASNTSSWTPNPTVATNGEVSVTAEACQSINIGAAPSSSPYGANYTPTVSATSGLSVALSIDPSATSICSISAGVVTMNAIGNCVIDATQTGNASWAPATEVTQTIPVVQATPTTPNVTNIPGSAAVGGSFTPTVSTNGDGVKSVSSNSPSVCTISAGVVSYLAVGTCSLTAHVANGTNYAAANGTAQTFSVGQGTPTTPTITNLPGTAAVGGSFTPSVSTNGDGVTSTTSNSTSVCTISAGVVSYLAVGTCSLTAHVANGTNYAAASGSPQTFSVGQGTPTTPTITNMPSNALVGATFTPTVSTNGDGVTSVASNSLSVCTISAGTVTFIAVGTCSLTAQLANGTNYTAATGTAQTVLVGSATHTNVVSFNSEGGTTVAPVEALNGQSITLPVAPQRAGYTFVGWFTTATGGVALTSPFVVSESTTLYAQWTQTSQSAPSTAPTAPVIVGDSQSKGTITVTITRLPGNGGSVVLEYLALMHGRWLSVTVNARHQFTIHGLSPHHRYTIRLRARNSVGLGTPSRPITVTVI